MRRRQSQLDETGLSHIGETPQNALYHYGHTAFKRDHWIPAHPRRFPAGTQHSFKLAPDSPQ